MSDPQRSFSSVSGENASDNPYSTWRKWQWSVPLKFSVRMPTGRPWNTLKFDQMAYWSVLACWSEGEGRHRYARTKMAREGKRNSNKIGKGGTSTRTRKWERRFRLRKEKLFGWNLKRTQDSVRASLDLSQEDAEETSFVPSALSIPRGAYVLI